ncbi:MAG: hypothetical protein Phog2KO_42690 [Phototrophicaceae bacterium]
MLKRLQSHNALFLGSVLLVLLIALPILTYPMGRDQGMYANIGNSILRGGTPFVDMWDIKPPPIYYIYAFGIQVFGATTQAIRSLDLFFVPFGMLGLYLLGGKMANKPVGLWAGLLYAVFYFNDGFQNLSQSDSLATIPTIWIAYASFRASREHSGSGKSLIFSLIAGLLSGVLLWFKPQQYALVASAFVVYHLIYRLRQTDRNIVGLCKESVAFALGGLLTGGILLAYFWSQGIISEILIVAEGTAAYNAQGYDLSAFIANMQQGFYFRWIIWHGLIILTGLWIIGFVAGIFAKNIQSTLDKTFVILWLLSGLGFAFMQAKGFDTHWFPMLAPMALIGADVIQRIIAWIFPPSLNPFSPQVEEGTFKALTTPLVGEGQGSGVLFVVLNTVFVIALLSIPIFTTWGQAWAYLSNQETQLDYWDTFQANDLKPEESLEVATFLRERVPAGDTLFIWGFRPEVYFMADLVPATRYQAHFPLVAPWYPQAWQHNNVDILWAAMPPYVLILEDDYMPWVTDFDADSHTLLQDYTELNNWLIANYERDEQIGDFIIWRRAPQ